MVAYPVQGGKAVGHASINPVVTRACGHDVHMSVLLGRAERLSHLPLDREFVVLMSQSAEKEIAADIVTSLTVLLVYVLFQRQILPTRGLAQCSD